MRVADLLERARRDVKEGRVPSCQLALARDGELVAFEAFGEASLQSRYVIFSVTKALVAAATWLLVGDREIGFNTNVADLVPGFGSNGKGAVTVDHLLLHTAGFPRAPMRPEEGADPERRRERFRTWRVDWEPGKQTAYHPTSAHWVLAEVIEQASGTDFRAFVNRMLGEGSLRLGAPAGDPLTVRIMGNAEELGNIRLASGEEFQVPEISDDLILRFNDPAVRNAGVPGAGATGNAAGVAMFFQKLLHNPDRRWDAAVLADGTGVVRNALPDPYTRVPANRTRGLVLAGDDGFEAFRGFGPGVSGRAFASPGLGGQIAWADPATGVSFCYLTNGIDADLVSAFRRSVSLSKHAAAAVPD